MKLHKEGYLHVFIASLLTAVLLFISYKYFGKAYPILFWILAIPLLLIWFWVLWFFRMPKRVFVSDIQNVFSPADGKVVVIEEVEETEYFKDKRIQVSVFMSPLNVHVNRNPISGIVKYAKYHPGKFLVAWHPKSSTDNERTSIVVENENTVILMRQVAGAMARRIRFYVTEGDNVKQNEEFGFIKFGSRVDLYLPLGTEIIAKIGDVVKGGQTVLAKIK
ncbi:MAG TPA: phosphatidylserine decarboxylase family protein [Chitinophagaceae bacterium]|nr:phosphatidylserine decarboxylase family protein [Chitinophagaceae bacterium]